MIDKRFLEKESKRAVRVTFTLPGGLVADRICLVGDFNDWNEESHAMLRSRDGGWFLTLELEPGRDYQFRYLCDGRSWINDSDADAYVSNRHGSSNFVVNTDPLFRRKQP